MLTHGLLNQHYTLTLDNGLLRVVVLPRKGADLYAIIHVPSGVDCLLKTPGGLQPPTSEPQAEFLDNYEGGWQMLLPNANAACSYGGVSIPFHGEVALLPWEVLAEHDDAQETVVHLGVMSRLLPLRVARRLRLRAGTPHLEIADRVTNEGFEPVHLVWGQHLVLGAPFLEAGCRLEIPGRTIVTPDQIHEPKTVTLAPGQHEPWPLALGRQPGTRIDLRAIPGPEAGTHDDSFVTDLEAGYFTVTNPRLRLAFRLDWDADLFRYLALWQPYGGATLPAELVDIYGLGLEPWVSRYNLDQALHHGEALELAPGASLETALKVSIVETS